jgi:hypothetical protein
MSFLSKAWSWNATDEEWRAHYPCDKYMDQPRQEFMRAIDVCAPAAVTFRWVCQLKVAPYSYDLLDNWFRRSPRCLTPGAEKLKLRQRFLVGPIVEFEQDRHITVVVSPGGERAYGRFSLTYDVRPTGPDSSRLVCKADLASRTRLDRVRWFLLAWGDLIMMRKQFLILKALAEKTALEADEANALRVGAGEGAE